MELTAEGAERTGSVLDDATITYLRETLAGIRYGRTRVRRDPQ